VGLVFCPIVNEIRVFCGHLRYGQCFGDRVKFA